LLVEELRDRGLLLLRLRLVEAGDELFEPGEVVGRDETARRVVQRDEAVRRVLEAREPAGGEGRQRPEQRCELGLELHEERDAGVPRVPVRMAVSSERGGGE